MPDQSWNSVWSSRLAAHRRCSFKHHQISRSKFFNGIRTCAAHQYLQKGENQWEPRRYRTEPNLQQTRGLGCSIPRCFIAMKHTSQHQVPYPSRTAPSGLKWSLRQLWQNVTSRQRLSAMTSTKFTKKESHNGTMLLLFPHPHVTSLFEHASQTWMGHFQFLARTSALPLWIWQLELGMLSIWRTASCFTTGWSINWLKWPTSGFKINKRKCSEISRRCTQAVGHEQTSESRKPAMQQLESYTHRQESRHGLRFPGRTTNDGGAAHVSARWPQFVHASSLKKGKASILSSCCQLLRCLHQWPPPTLLSP